MRLIKIIVRYVKCKISEVLLKRGDYGLVGELGRLKDRLTVIRREAKQLAHVPQPQEVIIPLRSGRIGDCSIQELSGRSSNAENVFFDSPQIDDQRSNSRRDADMNLSRIDLACNNVDPRSVMACEQGTSNGPSSARLSVPQVLQPDDISNPRSLEIDLSQSLTEIIASVHGVNKDPQLGINIISTHTDAWMCAMKSRQGNYEAQLRRMQENLVTMSITMQGAESFYKELQEDIEVLKSNSDDVWSRLKTDERRMDKLDESISTVERSVKENLETVSEWFADLTARSSPEIPREIMNSIQEVINDSSPRVAVDRMRDEIRELRDSLATSRYATEGLRGLVVNLSDQVSSNPPLQSPRDETLILRDEMYLETNKRECEIVRKGIERTEKQLRQLILNDIYAESVDISLIKKYKTIDVPCVHAAIGSIQKSLQRYVKFSRMDLQYCDEINDLLDEAENWCLRVEVLYNKAEVHSINTSKGDTADVGVFSDNAKVTVYEFLEAAEIAYLGLGNSVQKANRLYNRHLSEEIKSKLINKSDSYAEMKQWLILNYGGVSRIINDVICELSRRSKPATNNSQAKFAFYAHISGSLQRLERLSKVDGISANDLETCLYSRATLSSLSLVLPYETYSDWISEMTKSGLDYKNPVGVAAYSVFKDLCILERNKSEGSRASEKSSSPKMKPRSPKSQGSPRSKARSVHQTSEETEVEMASTSAQTAFEVSYHNTKWYQPNLKFPCPLGNHRHEVSTCLEFFSLSPAKRWNKMDKGKLCYACLLPKDVCTVRKCKFEAKVPETLKCQGCAPWACSKDLAPFKILFCRNKEHAQLRAPYSDMKKDLEKYIGKLGTTVVDSSIKFSANYTYQAFSLSPGGVNALGWTQEDFKDKPAPSINSETGEIVEVKSELIVPEVLEHSCYLMQTIKIGGSDVLVFFDRGANIHIIDGSLAEKEGCNKFPVILPV